MATELTELFREALELPDSERATLAGLLVESLEGPEDPDVESAWPLRLNAVGEKLSPAQSRPFPSRLLKK